MGESQGAVIATAPLAIFWWRLTRQRRTLQSPGFPAFVHDFLCDGVLFTAVIIHNPHLVVIQIHRADKHLDNRQPDSIVVQVSLTVSLHPVDNLVPGEKGLDDFLLLDSELKVVALAFQFQHTLAGGRRDNPLLNSREQVFYCLFRFPVLAFEGVKETRVPFAFLQSDGSVGDFSDDLIDQNSLDCFTDNRILQPVLTNRQLRAALPALPF